MTVRRAGTNRKLVCDLRMTWISFCYVMWKGEQYWRIYQLALTGQIEGRVSRGRMLWMLNCTELLGRSRFRRSGGRIAGESFKQRIVAGHDATSKQM